MWHIVTAIENEPVMAVFSDNGSKILMGIRAWLAWWCVRVCRPCYWIIRLLFVPSLLLLSIQKWLFSAVSGSIVSWTIFYLNLHANSNLSSAKWHPNTKKKLDTYIIGSIVNTLYIHIIESTNTTKMANIFKSVFAAVFLSFESGKRSLSIKGQFSSFR